MRNIALLALLVCVAALVRAQTPMPPANSQCTFTGARSPEIRGIHLGMGADKLMAVFPEEANRTAIENAIKESKRVHSYGVGRFDLRPSDSTANPRFSGVLYMTVEILDEHVTAFYVAYVGPRWANVDQFITTLSDAFHLPAAESWKQEGGSRKVMKCGDFAIYADVEIRGLNHHVWVRNESAQKVVNQRREAEEEKERQAFKP